MISALRDRVYARLDTMSMYRVMMYSLASIIMWGFFLSIFDVLPPRVDAYIFSLVAVLSGVFFAHVCLVRICHLPSHFESVIITGLILFLVLEWGDSFSELSLLFGIACGAIGLKYVTTLHGRHIANPVALALVCIGLLSFAGNIWWVGSRVMLPIVLMAGILIIMKTGRERLALLYIGVSVCMSGASAFLSGADSVFSAVFAQVFSWPTIFVAAFMLTEPLGIPAMEKRQDVYAVSAAVFGGVVPFHIGPLFATPELGLVVANIYTAIVDTQKRFFLSLKEKRTVGGDVVEYVFSSTSASPHIPGQYMEWTLPHAHADARGERRFFTLTSIPNTQTLSFALRHLPVASTWKSYIRTLPVGGTIYATQRGGDFVLRADDTHRIFIAGGIGCTPFIAMIRHGLATHTRLDATLFCCNKTEADIAFLDEISSAETIGLSTIHMLSKKPERSFSYEIGFITEEILSRHVPEWRSATFYISGPPALVSAYETLLRDANIKKKNIVTDYFPGLS